jgi:hypothetical protein
MNRYNPFGACSVPVIKRPLNTKPPPMDGEGLSHAYVTLRALREDFQRSSRGRL